MTAQDIPEVVVLGSDLHKESRYRALDFDPLKLWELGETMLNKPESWLSLVVELDKEIVGFFLGYVVEHFFGHELTAGDLCIYIKPEHRGGMTGARLIKRFDSWCQEKGVKEPLLGVSAGITPERTGRLYERLGYTEKLTVYKKPFKSL
tara:strand:- start:131 stop:577 length:447 start_codon:yes stop_codon:yes gene_type:complete